MLLGKRPRPPMKRTTSLKEFTFDLNTTAGEVSQSQAVNPFKDHQSPAVGGLTTVSPRSNRRVSADFETSQFLRSCGLCKRRLVPSRDLYMYRGDTAFCSNECRQQQMTQDERKEKCSLASNNEASSSSSSKSTKFESMAAV